MPAKQVSLVCRHAVLDSLRRGPFQVSSRQPSRNGQSPGVTQILHGELAYGTWDAPVAASGEFDWMTEVLFAASGGTERTMTDDHFLCIVARPARTEAEARTAVEAIQGVTTNAELWGDRGLARSSERGVLSVPRARRLPCWQQSLGTAVDLVRCVHSPATSCQRPRTPTPVGDAIRDAQRAATLPALTRARPQVRDSACRFAGDGR